MLTEGMRTTIQINHEQNFDFKSSLLWEHGEDVGWVKGFMPA